MSNYRNEIKPKIESLSHVNRLLFAVLTCEVLFPNYVFFSKKAGWGDDKVLQDGIVMIYQAILNGGESPRNEIEIAISHIDMITPDTEDFSGIITSFALDACNSVYSTLSYLIDHDINNLVDVAIYARDTVDMFIQEKEDLDSSDPNIEHKINSDLFMITEKYRQTTLINILTTLDNAIDSSLIEQLRTNYPIINLTLLP